MGPEVPCLVKEYHGSPGLKAHSSRRPSVNKRNDFP